MTLQRLKNRLRYWQRRLGLQVWDITDTNHRTALVRILAPEYADMFQPPAPAYEAENVLVHELLHLLLLPVVDTDGEPDITSVEQLINLLAEVLISLSKETQ